MTPQPIDDLDQPFVLHVKGQEQWPYMTRLWWGIQLIFGSRVRYYFCNSIRASFSGKEFLGLEYTGSNAYLSIGDLDLKDEVSIENLHPVTHLVIGEEYYGKNSGITDQ